MPHTQTLTLHVSLFIVTFCSSVELHDYSHPFNSSAVRKLVANTYQKSLSSTSISDIFTHNTYSIYRYSIKMVNNT